jgi:hypothetical protein
MSGLSALTVWSGRLAAAQPAEIKIFLTVTSGAITLLGIKNTPPIIAGTAASDFTQAAVNALLERDSAGALLSAASTSEINTSVAFGSTAMGTDMLGFVLYTAGQIDYVIGMTAQLHQASEDTRFAARVTSLPDTLTAGLFVTPAGNLAGRVVLTGLDSATGVVELTLHVFSK